MSSAASTVMHATSILIGPILRDNANPNKTGQTLTVRVLGLAASNQYDIIIHECSIAMILILLILNIVSIVASTNINLVDVCVQDKACFQARIVDHPITRAKGLSNETFLPENEGMLFIFPMESRPSFWAKNMQYPIDIIFINEDDIINYMVKNLPPCSADACPKYQPSQPVSKVLEINGGQSKKWGIHVGDSIQYYIEDT